VVKRLESYILILNTIHFGESEQLICLFKFETFYEICFILVHIQCVGMLYEVCHVSEFESHVCFPDFFSETHIKVNLDAFTHIKVNLGASSSLSSCIL